MRAYPSLCATVLLAIAALLLAPYAADAKNVNAVATSSEFYWLPSSYGDCDVTCGSGLRTRAVECYSGETVSDDASCADLTKPDTVTGCTLADCFTYEWSSSSWSGCDNLECGSAYSSRSVQCVTSTGLSIESSYCDGSAPVESEICTASSASCAALTNATWNWGEWTSCSASCGTGHETRDRWCIDSSDEVVDDTSCDCDGLPTYRTCNLGDCETFSWSITTYADCSVTCGTGYRERTIVCTSSVRGTVDDAECASALSYSKPTEVVRCVADAECPTYEWVGQGFGDCSVTCGTGQATQSVLCINSVSKDTVAESYCTGSFPLTVKDCVESDCVTCDWSAGSYSECDVTCGLGEQIREVSCLCSDGSVDASLSTCAGTMPEALLSCGEPCPNCFYAPGAWGECSATCGSEGVETRDINCVCDGESADLSACSALVNTYDSSASCNVVSCPTYSWKQGGYGDCPVTCGTSYTYQTVTCVSDLTGEEVEATYCDDTKPSTVSTCAAASACQSYHWSAGEFGSCTASCGNGYYTRKVWCENNVGVTVDDSLCSGTAPDATSICNEGACETYTWAHDSWSDCSATCRGGVATRTVTCVSSQRGVVANSHCDTDSQPAAIEGCNFDVKCPKYGWISYGWSACSASCGAGTMTQTLGCKNYRGAVMVDDSFCANLSVPTTVQVCSAMACEVYEWSESSLGDCSVTCGKGIATRTVHCQGQLYGTIDYTSTMCTGARPSETEDCDMTSCPTYSWSVGSFGDCSSTCDEGTQTRTVYCLSSDGSSVDDSFCAASVTKPDLTKTCNFGACQSTNYITTYEYVTGSFGDCSVTCGNGIELRTVQCEQITTVITNGESSSTTAWVEDSYCSELTRPSCHQSCATGVDCQGPTWSVVPSDVCSASCGSGYTTSSVTCKTVSGETVDDSLCDADSQPPSQESCNYGPCETFEWTTGSYSDCSVTCGSGIKTREVYCTSSQRGQVASSYCSGSAPTDHQVCESGVECVWCDWVPGSWSDCSATCGLGLNTRSVECLCSDGTTSETACELLTAYTSERVCSYGGSCETYSWSVGSYSDECSVTCGEGVMTRTASCVGSLGSVDETGVQCHELDTPITSKACSKAECEIFEYVYGKTWGECDVTCGFGTQTRTVSCVGSYGTVDETLEQCVSLTLLPTSRDCFPTTCEVCSWQVGSLADCSVTCGDGIETREVACVGNRGTVCDASECDGDAPEATVTCAMACCTTYSWYVGRYGDCSTTCGTGTKSREVFCHDNEGLVVDASYCDGSSPAVDETCETGVACTGPSWSNGDWSDCSASCGSGTRSRSVYCLAVDGSVLEDSECSGSAPAASEDCNLCSCETTEWEVSSWSECSVTCGTGFQTRSIECRSTLRGYVGASECSGTELADHQACSTTCYGWMAGEYGTCTDGVQTRNIYCVGTDASVDSTGDNCEGSQPSDSAVC